MSTETYTLIYHAEVSEFVITGHPFCYNIRPYATKSTTAPSSNVTLSVDCLDYLGGDSDAALIRMRGVPPENSGMNSWQSHVIIDAPKKGLSIGETDSRIRDFFLNITYLFESLKKDLRYLLSFKE